MRLETATTNFAVVSVGTTLTFAPIPTPTYGAAPFTVSATSASSGAVTYSVTSGPATISGSTVTVTGVGTVVLGASQAASGNYDVATATTNFTVIAATPTLAFALIEPPTYGVTPFGVSATSVSSGAVTYSVVSGPATISGSTVTVTGAGTVVLGASQVASGNYGAATATTSFTVSPATPVLVFAPIGSPTDSAAPFTVSATSASSGAVTYTVTSGPATIVGSTVTVTNTGTVVLGASQVANGNYAAATATTSFTVAATAPAITTQPASQTITVGQTATFNVVATGTAPLTYQWYQGGGVPTPIPGATSSSYTTPATSSSGSSQYTVIVTNSAGNVTSNTATLTVKNGSPVVPSLSCNSITPPFRLYHDYYPFVLWCGRLSSDRRGLTVPISLRQPSMATHIHRRILHQQRHTL